MPVEQCQECGFDSTAWTDASALKAVGDLPNRWRDAVEVVASDDLNRRPRADMWSIGEYANHVREVLFSVRYLLDTAVAAPDSDIGEVPNAPFEPETRLVDVDRALSGIARETHALTERLTQLPDHDWNATVTLGGDEVDAHWMVRHALHDATHHLLDVERLRALLG